MAERKAKVLERYAGVVTQRPWLHLMIVSLLYFGGTCFLEFVAFVVSHTHDHLLQPEGLDSRALSANQLFVVSILDCV